MRKVLPNLPKGGSVLLNIPLNRLTYKRIETFWSRVDKSAGENSCWPWLGSRDGSGYGKMKVDAGINARTHRIAYLLATGKDPGESMVCHTCDNPPCCNPAHLWLGDNRANQLDASAKGRKPPSDSAGEKNGAAKLTAADVDRIRAMIAGGSTNKAIARVFGVTHQAISRIRRGRSWGKEPLQPKYASLRR